VVAKVALQAGEKQWTLVSLTVRAAGPGVDEQRSASKELAGEDGDMENSVAQLHLPTTQAGRWSSASTQTAKGSNGGGRRR
jgi:hypothetical protein